MDKLEKEFSFKIIFFIISSWSIYRFEETNEQATSYKASQKCIGGYARAVTKIKELQQTRTNPIFLNAGDNFQGTLWYSLGRWNVTSQFLNMLNADAIVSFSLFFQTINHRLIIFSVFEKLLFVYFYKVFYSVSRLIFVLSDIGKS